jgi:hypothetical protein
MIKSLRAQQLSGDSTATGLGKWAANNFSMINNSVPTLLNTVSFAHKVGGWRRGRWTVRGGWMGGCWWCIV